MESNTTSACMIEYSRRVDIKLKRGVSPVPRGRTSSRFTTMGYAIGLFNNFKRTDVWIRQWRTTFFVLFALIWKGNICTIRVHIFKNKLHHSCGFDERLFKILYFQLSSQKIIVVLRVHPVHTLKAAQWLNATKNTNFLVTDSYFFDSFLPV